MQRASPCESSTRSPKATTTVGSARRATPLASSSASPTRKSRLPAMKPTVRSRRRRGEHLDAARLEAALGHVVADPDLEQVAEDEDGVGVGVAQVRGPGVERARRVLGEVQVARAGRSRASAPARRRSAASRPRQRRRARRRRCHGAGARSTPTSGDDGRARDRHVVERHVGVAAAVAGAHLLDRVDDVLARDDAAEDRVAPALRRLRLEVRGTRCRRR